MEQSPSWEANQLTLQLVKKFPAFMEPESPSPYPQVPATCPYPEPTPSGPHDPLQLPEDPSQYYPPIYVLVSPVARVVLHIFFMFTVMNSNNNTDSSVNIVHHKPGQRCPTE